MPTKQPPTFSGQLREAIEAGPKTRYQIAKETGLDEGLLSRFVHGKSGLSVSSIDKLCECLGLELRPFERTRAKKGR
jgi:transcriptional regulator with XRE-family HTH domain